MANLDAAPPIVRAVPLVGLSALGLGPFAGYSDGSSSQLGQFQTSHKGRWLALDSAGVVGRRLVLLTHACGGILTPEQLRFQTAGADSALIEAELARMVDAELLSRHTDGTLAIGDDLRQLLGGSTHSMADSQATTADQVLAICRRLQINAPSRKQERIDAIAAHFADPETGPLAVKRLGKRARDLLDRIVATAGPFVTDGERLGLYHHDLLQLSDRRYNLRVVRDNHANPLAELVDCGFVGINHWEQKLWLWQEVFPALPAPFYPSWVVASAPSLVERSPAPAQLPGTAALVDRALRHWAQAPPPTLKNREPRLGKAAIASTAKALGINAGAVDLVARLALDLGLLLTNTVAITGRGRNRRADQVWLADPALVAAWDQSTLVVRWSRLVAAWCRPESFANQQQLLCNRHLVLWELSNLPLGVGYDGDEAFASWIADRHGTVGHEGAVTEVLADLRVLGVIPAEGPIALTEVARRLFDDPASVADGLGSADVAVVVQGDLTVLVPPGTDHEVHQRLIDLSVVVSEGAVQVLRLDEGRITRAVQAGSSGADIVAFLHQVSSVPLVDAVTRLVDDAAARAHRVSLTAVATVVVVTDPADLILACSVKAAKLEAVSDTVAVSALPLDKVRAALDRKGLAPAVTGGATTAAGTVVTPRSASGEAAAEPLRVRAEQARRMAESTGNTIMQRQAARLDEMAARLADPRIRLDVPPVLTLTPARAAALGSKPTGRARPAKA